MTDETSAVFIAAGYQGIVSACIDIEKLVDAFRTGRGVAWEDHDSRLFVALRPDPWVGSELVM